MKRNNKSYNEKDWFMNLKDKKGEEYLLVPLYDIDGNDMKKYYEKIGFKIWDKGKDGYYIKKENYRAYWNKKMLERNGLPLSYASVVVNYRNEIILEVYTKRLGMFEISFECLAVYDPKNNYTNIIDNI